MTRHIPVLLNEVLEGLHLKDGDTVVDATLGGGGYTRALAAAVGPQGRVIALDRDADAIARTTAAGLPAQVTVVHANFADIATVLDGMGVAGVQGVVADLGFSSDQVDDPSRGLSFLADGPLDMRLDRREPVTAADLVATADATELARTLREYGDESHALRIARAIVAARAVAPIVTTAQLAAVVADAVPARERHGRIHPATRTFQALRIAINHEFDDLQVFLAAAADRLLPGGRLAVVSFHSGEDAMVKRFVRAQARGCVCPPTFPVCRCGGHAVLRVVTARAVRPTDAEVAVNPRSRSARLRVAEKVG